MDDRVQNWSLALTIHNVLGSMGAAFHNINHNSRVIIRFDLGDRDTQCDADQWPLHYGKLQGIRQTFILGGINYHFYGGFVSLCLGWRLETDISPTYPLEWPLKTSEILEKASREHAGKVSAWFPIVHWLWAPLIPGCCIIITLHGSESSHQSAPHYKLVIT